MLPAIRTHDRPVAGTPFTQAKASCTAAWTATKTQCLSVKMSAEKGLAMVKKAVTDVGAVIKRVVESSILPAGAAAGNASKSNSPATVEEFGEGADLNEEAFGVDQQAHTMAHAACQAMWQEVESLCRQADSAAEQGHAALVKVISASAVSIHKRLEQVIKQHSAPAPAKKAGNATKPAATKPAAGNTTMNH